MKKLNKKGFSLVELIVVVAIMAVLVGVLAPSLLRYVEKTRVQKDISAVAEVEQAVKIACADEKVNAAVSGTGATGMSIVIGDTASGYTLKTASDTPRGNALEAEVAKTIAAIDLTSNALNTKTVTVTATITNGTVSVAVSTTGLVANSDAETAWTAAGFTNTP
ncbi:MAG: type II secretion system protein [Oscillospiraceae bacterium]|nr:type II secretion system protein [Oscillospiraceae bacterium]